MSTRALLLISLCFASCSSNAASIRDVSVHNADVLEREMDLLYECGLEQAAARELSIERSDSTARVYQTSWIAEDEDRWRLTLLIQVHPRFGPGAHAVITRDRWIGGGTVGGLDEATLPIIEPDSRGWVRARGTSSDTQVSDAIGTGVRLCWDARSELAD